MTKPRLIWHACTQCQRDVIVVLARTGGSNKQIAEELGITAQMVKSRLRRIADKLKIKGRTALVTAYLLECQDEQTEEL